MKKFIIFDCDGVLVDSEILANKIGAQILEKSGYYVSVEECIKLFTGLNDQSERALLAKNYNINLPDNFFIERQQAIIKSFETELTPLMKSVLNVLRSKKVDFAVASSSPRTRVIQSLKLTGQLDFFHENSIFTSEQVTNGKPAPDLFLFAANQMGYAPDDCIVIEDSPAGIEAAQSANMLVMGFLGGGHTQYDWYQHRISHYGVPMFNHANDLLHKLLSLVEFNK